MMDSSSETDSEIVKDSVVYTFTLSKRGERFLAPPLKYIQYLIESFNQKDDERRTICLAVAENKLTHDLLLEKIASISLADTIDESSLNYTSSNGSYRFREKLSKFMGNYLFNINHYDNESEHSHVHGSSSSGRHYPHPDQLVIGPGCGGILHELSFLLFDSDDSVLIPTPYYPAFDHDFYDLGDVKCIEISMVRDEWKAFDNDSHSPFTIEALEAGYNRAVALKHHPKALLLTNPSNPLGMCYNKKVILLAIEWCRSKGIHIIIDEIYGLSVFDNDTERFVSVVNILNNCLGDHVHVLWSLSKDFGCSGLRIGVCYSQNKTLLKALGSCNDAFQVSSIALDIVGNIIDDDVFISKFLKESRVRTYASYRILIDGLSKIGDIHVTRGGAAMFVYVDMRSILEQQTFESENNLLEELYRECGILLTPGSSCHCPIPGFFRCCFAWVSPSELTEMLVRLKVYVDAFRLKHKRGVVSRNCIERKI